MKELIINGKEARTEWGIVANTRLVASLLSPPQPKDPIQSTSRLEHGTRTVIPEGTIRLSARELTLEVGMTAPTYADFLARYADFIDELTGGWLRIETDFIPGAVFKCRYVSCTQFTNYNGRAAKFILRLEEPNPADRS